MTTECKCHVRPKTTETHGRNKARADGWQSVCKFCLNEFNKNYYQEHRDFLLARQKQYHKERRQAWVDLLTVRGLITCSTCGYSKCFAAIDFHHVEPSAKEAEIAQLIRHIPTDQHMKELDKVTPLCRNCHAELHYQEEHNE